MTAGQTSPLASPLDYARSALDDLTDDELLLFHREVCRRAAKVYEPRFKQIRDQNFESAMKHRDTRFVKGLSVLENITRCSRLGMISDRPVASLR